MPPIVIRPNRWALAIEYAGNEKVLGRYEADLRRMAAESGADYISVLGDDVRPAVFAHKREFIPIALDSSPATTIMKIGVLPSRMKDVLNASAKAADTNQVPWAAMARGLGVIYVALLPSDRSDATHQGVTTVTNQIFEAGTTFGANMTIPWCPAEWKSTLKVWGPERSDLAEMQKVKKVFDPLGIFSPGRFAGGL
jgi:FAD/FMN-containing dehydrogenase